MVDHHVTQFSGETIRTIHHATIHHDARTHTRAEGDHDKVLHAACNAVGHFAQCRRVGIVCHPTRHTERLFEEVTDRNNALPNQVRRAFDRTIIEIAARRADTHTADVVDAAHHVECRLQRFHSRFHIVFDIRIGLRFDGRLRNNRAALVHDAEHRVRTAHVEPDHIRLFEYFFHEDACFILILLFYLQM